MLIVHSTGLPDGLRMADVVKQGLCVFVFFTLTDRASSILSNIRGCQSGTWSAGQEKVRGTSIKLQRGHTNKNKAETTKTKEVKQNKTKKQMSKRIGRMQRRAENL